MLDEKKLSNISTEELKREIERREKKKRNIPQPLSYSSIDWEVILRACRSYTEYIAENDHEPKDGKHFLYESLMTIVYGDDFWKWFNQVIE